MIKDAITLAPYVAQAVVVAVLYSVAISGAGLSLLRWLARRDVAAEPLARSVEIVSAITLALGLYASLWVLLGLVGALRAPVLGACLLPGLVAAGVGWGRGWPSRAQILRFLTDAWHEGPVWWLLGFGIISLVAILAVASFEPPYGDAVAFYMSWPKIIAASGWLVPLPGYEAFSSIWTVGEMHFAALMTFDGEAAAKFFVWIITFAAGAWVWVLAAECGLGRRGRLLAVAMLLTSTAVVLVSWDGKTDLIAVPPALGAIWWALSLGTARHRTAIVATGLMAGTAVAAKFSYIPPLGAALLVLTTWRARTADKETTSWRRRAAVWLAAIGGVAAFLVLVQIIKNQVVLQQPLAPVITFVGDHIRCCGFTDAKWYSPPVVWRIILTFPLAVSFGSYWAQYGVLSPLVIGLLPLLAFWRPGADDALRRLRWVSLAGVAAMAAWLATAPSQMAPRYFLGPLLLFVFLPAWLGERASREGPSVLRHATGLGAVVVVVGVTPWAISHAQNALHYSLGMAGANGRAPIIEEQRVADKVNAAAPRGARVLLVSYYSYFMRPDLIQCLISAVDLGPSDTVAAKALGPDYINTGKDDAFHQLTRVDAKVIQALGVDYVMRERAVNPNFYVDEQVLEPIYGDLSWAVYRVHLLAQSPGAGERCVTSDGGRWVVELQRQARQNSLTSDR